MIRQVYKIIHISQPSDGEFMVTLAESDYEGNRGVHEIKVIVNQSQGIQINEGQVMILKLNDVGVDKLEEDRISKLQCIAGEKLKPTVTESIGQASPGPHPLEGLILNPEQQALFR